MLWCENGVFLGCRASAQRIACPTLTPDSAAPRTFTFRCRFDIAPAPWDSIRPVPSRVEQGLALHQQGKLREAEAVYREVLSREPNNPDALHLLGVIATQVKQYEAAVQLIEAAIRNRPTVAFYYNNLGNAYRGLVRRKDAYDAYGRALQLQPDYVEARINRGTTLREQAMFAEAVAEYEIAAKTQPAIACSGLATALNDQGRVEESIAAYRRAVALDPTHSDSHSNLLYELHFSDRVEPQQLFEEHVKWAKQHADALTNAARPHSNDRSPDRRLRVGYVSGDFRDHPVGRFLWPMIEHRDQQRFEIVCFSNVERQDAFTAEYRASVDEWHDTAGLDDATFAEFIRERKIDILVDLAGHTSGGRMQLFARKPAPVQITYLGYPDTTGMRAIDVRITDALADPEGAESRHAERVERIEGCFLCYPLRCATAPISDLPAKSNGHLTFGSFNNLAKISPTTIQLWKSVLETLPTAKMIIKTTSMGDVPTRDIAARRFASQGLPMDRVTLLGPRDSQDQHLDTYRAIDVALDTYPYNGTTTTCEALAMGIPVVSFVGQHHASRVGLSILTAAGHPEWCTDDSSRFAGIACAFAEDLDKLEQHRATMRQTLAQSTLCNEKGFAAKIETIYRESWTRWCRG